MLFFQSSKLVLFIDKKHLVLYGKDSSEKEELEFTKDVIKDGEIADKDKFIGEIVTFLAKSSFKKQKVICILSEDLLHQKTILFSNKEEVNKEAEEFFEKIHIPEDKRVVKTLTDDEHVYLIVTDKEFYSAIIDAFDDVGWEIEKVVPITVFYKDNKKSTLSTDEVANILKNTKLAEIGDFLLEENAVSKKDLSGSKETLSENPKGNKSTLFIIGFIGIITIGVLGTLVLLGILQYPGKTSKEQLANGSVTPSPTFTPTPTVVLEADPSEKLKSEAKIQVLNGTGVKGQAGKAAEIFEELGFENVKTGNADDQDESNTTTTVAFSSKIPEGVQKKVIKELEKTFAKVLVKDPIDSSDFDIVLTTGKYSSE